jgi:hypothetical protein
VKRLAPVPNRRPSGLKPLRFAGHFCSRLMRATSHAVVGTIRSQSHSLQANKLRLRRSPIFSTWPPQTGHNSANADAGFMCVSYEAGRGRAIR